MATEDMHPNEFFDCIYCVVPVHLQHRWYPLQQRLEELDIRVERFLDYESASAIAGGQLESQGGRPGLGGATDVAKALTFLRLLDDSIRNRRERILVLEHGVCLNRQFSERFQAVAELPQEWDLLYLGCFQEQWSGVRFCRQSFYTPFRSGGTFAWAASADLIRTLAAELVSGPDGIEQHLGSFQATHPERCFAFAPNLVIADMNQRGMTSTEEVAEHAVRMRWDLSRYYVPLSSDVRMPTESGPDQLPRCSYRKSLEGCPSHFFCKNPHVHSADGFVDVLCCSHCRWHDEPAVAVPRSAVASDAADGAGERISARHEETPVVNPKDHEAVQGGEDRAACAGREARAASSSDGSCRSGLVGGGFRWAVGVTTAPRQRRTLGRCLYSLREAGWPEPHLFAEPKTRIPKEFQDLTISVRAARMGAFPNWYLAVTELVMTEPHADAFFLLQDDCLLAAGMRDYLEGTLWPAAELGVVSVYCPRHYSRERPAGYYREGRGRDTWGALAYVFPNPSARAALSDATFLNHRFAGPRDGLRNIDTVVGLWCTRAGLPYFVHDPSLVQHIGATSTMWASANTGNRRAKHFVSDVKLLGGRT